MELGNKKRRRNKKRKRLVILLIMFTAIIFTIAVEAKKHTTNEQDNKIKSTYVKVQHDAVNDKSNFAKDKNTTQKDSTSAKTKDTSNANKPKKNKETNKSSKIKKSKPKTTKSKDSSKYNFKDDLFLGDSLTEGLSFYELIGDKNVIGIKGLTTVKAMDQVNDIAKRKPKNIFILLGDNDLQMAVNGEKFASNYLKLIKMIKAKSPSSNIYIQSIPPVTQKAEQKNKLITNSRINQFNNAAKNMAQNEKVNFIDISPIFKNNKDLYEKDGIHLKYKFYGIWLDFIKRSEING